MSNPLISLMASQANNNNPAMNMISQFAKFRQGITPEMAQARINEMVASGQVSAQQLEQAKMMAQQFSSLLKK